MEDLSAKTNKFTLTAGYLEPGKYKKISYDRTLICMFPGLQHWDIIYFYDNTGYVVTEVYSETAAVIVRNIYLLIGAYILKYWRKIKKAYGFK